MRRAKIVCTLGPVTASKDQIRALVEAGMDVARLNLSHGDYAAHEQVYRYVREASDELGRAVGILVDLQGPKIRTGRFAQGPVVLHVGDEFTITTDDILGDQERVSTTFTGLPGDVSPGDLILIDDGKVTLRATSVSQTDVVTEVVEGGFISNNKGINLPGVAVSVPALSEKDREDLRWALRLRADVVALSFVRSAADIADVHAIMDEVGLGRLPVVAKIEKPQAVDNLEAIVVAFDGIMVARGDLGVELPLEQLDPVADPDLFDPQPDVAEQPDAERRQDHHHPDELTQPPAVPLPHEVGVDDRPAGGVDARDRHGQILRAARSRAERERGFAASSAGPGRSGLRVSSSSARLSARVWPVVSSISPRAASRSRRLTIRSSRLW